MNYKALETEKEYKIVLQRFEEIFQAELGTKESDEADVLAALIKDYEDRNYIIDSPDK